MTRTLSAAGLTGRDGLVDRVRWPGPAVRSALGRARDGLGLTLAGPDRASEPKWRSPAERRAAYVAVGLVTLALCAVSVATMHPVLSVHQVVQSALPPRTGYQPRRLWQDLVAVAVVAPLPLAVRYPLLAWRIGWVGLAAVPAMSVLWWGGWPWGPLQVLALMAAFCVAGFRQGRQVLWCMWALTLLPYWLWLWFSGDVPNLDGPAGATVAFTALAIALDSLRSRLHAQRALAVHAERAEAERARLAVLEERTRIARELHDVVAHRMSLVAVQAETAPYRLSDLPESARAEFIALSGVAREALAEMRGLLGVLRRDQPAALAPQPRRSDLPELVDAARRACLPVQPSAPPAAGKVPSGVGLCAYRIVQGSLSNASQHAPGSEVTVSVDTDASAVVLRVVNGPASQAGLTGSDGKRASGSGHGIAGMRERVSLLGGSLSAGPAPDGGFVVSAVLPLRNTA